MHEVTAQRLPKENCHRCRGEGHLGTNRVSGQLHLCACVTRVRSKGGPFTDVKREQKRLMAESRFDPRKGANQPKACRREARIVSEAQKATVPARIGMIETLMAAIFRRRRK